MPSVEQLMAVAYRSGRSVAQRGGVVSENPYDATGPTAVERVRALMWVRGYGTGNPVSPEADVVEDRGD